MSPVLIAATALRGAGFAALAALIGGLSLDLLVLPREPPEVAPVRRRLRRVGAVCLAILVVTSAGDLVTRAETMAGGGLANAVQAIPAVLAGTHFGWIWIARFAALALAIPACFIDVRAARVAGLLLAVAVAATTSLTGHAADRGDLTVASALDWLHVLSTAAWTGGLLCLAIAVLGAASTWPRALLGAVTRRFSRLAALCLLAAVITGSYNAWAQLPAVSALWTTFYGRVLLVKLVLVAALICFGAVNRYAIVPRLGPRRRAGLGERVFRIARWALLGSPRVAGHARALCFRAYVGREAVLALLVFAATAVLVDSTPARHAGHAEHAAMAEPTPVRVTMEELHASGGVPKGWQFAPPAGDPARGREVFRRLACYTCHRVPGHDFPASAGIGPDLAGVGEHHPAGYILESILNPNAVVVEGSGYTTPDGKSIMPDYRNQLTVPDLLDLVSYLRSL
jgi:copper resistance protein D